MISVILELKEPLNYVFRNTENEEFINIFFNDADWFLLTELKRVFEVFVKLSVKL